MNLSWQFRLLVAVLIAVGAYTPMPKPDGVTPMDTLFFVGTGTLLAFAVLTLINRTFNPHS